MDEERRTLFMGNLTQDVTEALLHELCLQAGPVEKVALARPKKPREDEKKKKELKATTANADSNRAGDSVSAADAGKTGGNASASNAVRKEDEVAFVEVRGCYYFIQNNAAGGPEKEAAVTCEGDGAETDDEAGKEKSEQDAKELEIGTEKQKEDAAQAAEEADADQEPELVESEVPKVEESNETEVPECEAAAECTTEKKFAPEEKQPTSEELPNQIAVKEDKDSNRHLGYAFVLFEHESSVAYAVQVFRGTELFGRRLTVQFKSKNGSRAPITYPRWANANGNANGGQPPARAVPRKNAYNFHDARLTSHQGSRYPGSRRYAMPTYLDPRYLDPRDQPNSFNGCNFRLPSGNRYRNVAGQEDYAYIPRLENTFPEYDRDFLPYRDQDGVAAGGGMLDYEERFELPQGEPIPMPMRDVGPLSLEERKEFEPRLDGAASVDRRSASRGERRVVEGDRERPRGCGRGRGRPTYEDFVVRFDKGETEVNVAWKKPSECYVKLSESFELALDKFRSAKKVEVEVGVEVEEEVLKEPAKPRRRKNRKK